MAGTKESSVQGLVSEARDRLTQEVNAQAEQLDRLELGVQELRERQKSLESAIQGEFDALESLELPEGSGGGGGGSLEKLLGSVRNLITATLPGQVLDVLTEEAEQLGVRAAVFEVRGKAAWGASARGFGSSLSEKAFRALVVPLNQENPFRQVYETGGHVDINADTLKKARNILDKLKPGLKDPILLLPIRSAGSVSAILYADPGGKGEHLPADALKILSEFAGAQLDRLIALSGATPEEARAEAEAAGAVTEARLETGEPEAWEQAMSAGIAAQPEAAAPPPPPAAPSFDISELSEEEQKCHRDAKRFAKLLVSEIELYNKAKVADGRKNKDLYKRLKADIERSRQTYGKRFSKTVAKQYDYFHEELVKTLAANDADQLGSDYPGPSS